MSLMALLLVVTAGVLTGFLYPRSVVVKVVSLNSTKINSSYWRSPPVNQSYDVLLGIEASKFD